MGFVGFKARWALVFVIQLVVPLLVPLLLLFCNSYCLVSTGFSCFPVHGFEGSGLLELGSASCYYGLGFVVGFRVFLLWWGLGFRVFGLWWRVVEGLGALGLSGLFRVT